MGAMKRLTWFVLLSVALAGCADAATPASTPNAVVPTQYSSVVALRDDAVSAGYPCPSWNQDNKVVAAAESGTCSDSDVFSTYLDRNSTQDAAALLKSTPATNLLVGPNWIINAGPDGIRLLQAALGGDLVTGPPTVGTVSSVVELRDAAVNAGYSCGSWDQDDAVTAAKESGTCAHGLDTFAVFSSTETTEEMKDQFLTLAAKGKMKGTSGLFGSNWAILAPSNEMGPIAVALGGERVS